MTLTRAQLLAELERINDDDTSGEPVDSESDPLDEYVAEYGQPDWWSAWYMGW